MKKLILASQSPRRRELLSYLGYPFAVIAADIIEHSTHREPAQIVEDLAQQKAHKVSQENPDAWVLGSDTIVSLEGKILGKPQGREGAQEMLSALAGKTHQVFTGVALYYQAKCRKCFSVKTEVTFSDISSAEMQRYLASDEPYDKAGAYGIQGMALGFITAIEGSYSNVVGLPLYEVKMALQRSLNLNS